MFDNIQINYNDNKDTMKHDEENYLHNSKEEKMMMTKKY